MKVLLHLCSCFINHLGKMEMGHFGPMRLIFLSFSVTCHVAATLFTFYVGVDVGAHLRSQPILRWAIAQLRILSEKHIHGVSLNINGPSLTLGKNCHVTYCINLQNIITTNLHFTKSIKI